MASLTGGEPLFRYFPELVERLALLGVDTAPQQNDVANAPKALPKLSLSESTSTNSFNQTISQLHATN